jgi:archaellum biogenesis protein FlaJ (TadC family)
MELFLKITLAIVLVMMLWRLWPAAKHWMENGPKGTNNDWMTFALIIAAIVGFVVLMVMSVRN